LHNEELLILYSSPNIIRQIKSRRMRWAGYVERMGEERNVYRVLIGKQMTTVRFLIAVEFMMHSVSFYTV
jgi:hypothetical protein